MSMAGTKNQVILACSTIMSSPACHSRPAASTVAAHGVGPAPPVVAHATRHQPRRDVAEAAQRLDAIRLHGRPNEHREQHQQPRAVHVAQRHAGHHPGQQATGIVAHQLVKLAGENDAGPEQYQPQANEAMAQVGVAAPQEIGARGVGAQQAAQQQRQPQQLRAGACQLAATTLSPLRPTSTLPSTRQQAQGPGLRAGSGPAAAAAAPR